MTQNDEAGKVDTAYGPKLRARRHFLRTLTAGGCLYLMPMEKSQAAAEESRLVQGELKSWRSNPRLKRFAIVFDFLERPDLKELPVGKHVINEGAYAMIDKSPSLDPSTVQFEVHRKYIDVHYMIAGQVTTGFASVEKLQMITPYNEEDEAGMYAVPAVYTKVKLYPGMFAVFFPGGGHMPNCHLDGPHDLHKVVVKVRHDYGT